MDIAVFSTTFGLPVRNPRWYSDRGVTLTTFLHPVLTVICVCFLGLAVVCETVRFSDYLSVWVSESLSVCFSVYLIFGVSESLSICFSEYLDLLVSESRSIWVSERLNIWVSEHLIDCVSWYLSPCVPEYLTEYLGTCVSESLSPSANGTCDRTANAKLHVWCGGKMQCDVYHVACSTCLSSRGPHWKWNYVDFQL